MCRFSQWSLRLSDRFAVAVICTVMLFITLIPGHWSSLFCELMTKQVSNIPFPHRRFHLLHLIIPQDRQGAWPNSAWLTSHPPVSYWLKESESFFYLCFLLFCFSSVLTLFYSFLYLMAATSALPLILLTLS